MENAGRSIAECLKKRFTSLEKRDVVILAGKGNNGGDGFVAARYLFNAGAYVKVFYLGEPEKFTAIAFTNYQILLKMNIETCCLRSISMKKIDMKDYPVIVDAIFGSGIRGEILGIEAELIEKVNRSESFVLCADIPSGLNPDTGEVSGLAVKGRVTLGFGFAKRGFYKGKGPEYCGDIEIADIGFPRFFYNKN